MVYTLTDKRGEIVTGLARVSGILRTRIEVVDGNMCLLPIDAVRGILGYGPDEATFVALFLDDNRASDRVAQELRGKLPAGVAALTWHELQPDLAYYINAKWSGLMVMGVVMLLLTAAGIFNTLFVSVLERRASSASCWRSGSRRDGCSRWSCGRACGSGWWGSWLESSSRRCRTGCSPPADSAWRR